MNAHNMNLKNKALFLDRDGVINVDYGHVYKQENFVFIKGIFELCKRAQDSGYLIIIITNQAGIGKGFYTKEEFINLNEWMLNKFSEKDIHISKTYYCPHKPDDGCRCRKPEPGMILDAFNEFNINPQTSILIGDKKSDLEAGSKAGILTNIYFNGDNHLKTIKLLNDILTK